jgi:hypothetical protein
MEDHLRALGTGTLHLFSTWKQHAGVPHVAAGAYTIWRRADGNPATTVPGPGQLIYVGHSGRNLTAEAIAAQRKAGERKKALWSRLEAHASGSRSSDQFSVYIGDRFVLPTMSADDIEAVAAGRVDMDALVRNYIVAHLAFRWVETPDGATARALETAIQRGHWAHGKPFLNPR